MPQYVILNVTNPLLTGSALPFNFSNSINQLLQLPRPSLASQLLRSLCSRSAGLAIGTFELRYWCVVSLSSLIA
jgi:hypothetical protein